MKTIGFYTVLIGAVLAGWSITELIKKGVKPRQSFRRTIIYMLAMFAFIILYTALIVWLVTLIFGKP